MTGDSELFWFGVLLSLTSILVILVWIGLEEVPTPSQKSDISPYSPVWQRMNQLEIPSWQALQQRSGFTHFQVSQIRRGYFEQLTLKQLHQLALALQWSLAELIENLGIASRVKNSDLWENYSPRFNAELEEIQQQCSRLREELKQQANQLKGDFQKSCFEQLQTLFTNYPSACKMAQEKPDLPAKNLVALLTPLDNLLASWEYESIGAAWEQVPYNPQLHQPDTADMIAGELVYIRFVGYRQGEQILCPAKVSRTLPGGIKKS